jgi:hypothetical protein
VKKENIEKDHRYSMCRDSCVRIYMPFYLGWRIRISPFWWCQKPAEIRRVAIKEQELNSQADKSADTSVLYKLAN